jgi:signal transduction histidine kinase
MDLEPFVLNIIIEKVIRQVIPMTCGKDIKIINNCKEDITIMIDALHITEVLKNLLINAIEAIEIEGTIYVETELINGNVCLSIVDNGVGIPQKSIEKVLTPFYSTKKGKNNFGLGLSYCYKVMKCHNGSLKINSIVNQGTKMSLLFPIERVLTIKNSVSAEM